MKLWAVFIGEQTLNHLEPELAGICSTREIAEAWIAELISNNPMRDWEKTATSATCVTWESSRMDRVLFAEEWAGIDSIDMARIVVNTEMRLFPGQCAKPRPKLPPREYIHGVMMARSDELKRGAKDLDA